MKTTPMENESTVVLVKNKALFDNNQQGIIISWDIEMYVNVYI